jgi:hypothetical protein
MEPTKTITKTPKEKKKRVSETGEQEEGSGKSSKGKQSKRGRPPKNTQSN